MPATPDTFVRLAKYGVAFVVICVNCTRGRIEKNWLIRRVQVTDVSTPDTTFVSSNPNSVVWSVCVRWYANNPISWLRLLMGCVTRVVIRSCFAAVMSGA